MDQDLDAVVAEARTALGYPAAAEDGAEAPPRFELFHAASSLCSQKVRVVLTHHAVPFASRQLKIFEGQTYLPEYVRLRMVGCEDYGGALVSHHSGSTSASGFGCDGAVVPTLVDWTQDRVLVDSHRICLRLDDLVPDARKLRPAHLADAIDEDVDVIDHLPNYQMLMGRTSAQQESAAGLRDKGAAFSQRKVAWCDRYLAENADDPRLTAAYTAKRAKELSAADRLFSPEAMQAAYESAESALAALESKLAARRSAWLYSDDPTLSDLFWGVELSRMNTIGAARFWENGRLPHVHRFVGDTAAIPSVRTAVMEWPGALV